MGNKSTMVDILDIKVEKIIDQSKWVTSSESNYYLIATSASWMEHNRINKFYGFWKRLSKKYPELKFVEKCDYPIIEGNRVKYGGIASIPQTEFDFVLKNISGEFDVCLLASTLAYSKISELLISIKDVLALTDMFNYEKKVAALFSIFKDKISVVRDSDSGVDVYYLK